MRRIGDGPKNRARVWAVALAAALLLLLLAVRVSVGDGGPRLGLGLPFAGELPLPCDQAEGAVYARHPALFGLISARSGQEPQYWCGSPRADGTRPIRIYWTRGGQVYSGTYMVSATGAIVPDDEGAATLDDVASSGFSPSPAAR
jgi:hypothetical protein